MLPNDLNAEAGVLSCILNDALSAVEAFKSLREADFFSPVHKIIFRAFKALFDEKSTIDLITLQSELKRVKKLDFVGGVDFLVRIDEVVMSGTNIQNYINIVKELSKKRHIVVSIENVKEMIEKGVEYSEIIDTLMHCITDHETTSGSTVQLSDVISNMVLNYDSNTDLKRSFPVHLGFMNSIKFNIGKVIVIAARPAMGKSALATQLALDWGQQGFNVLICSLEMDKVEVGVRLVSQLSMIDSKAIMEHYIPEHQISRFIDCSESLMSLPICINDERLVTAPSLRSTIMRYILEHGEIDILIVDYLQLMRDNNSSGNKTQEITEISRSLKMIAGMFQCCVVALSQLNRSLENREEKRPRLADLRESGAIEQDADIVGFLYREVIYNEDADPTDAEFIVRKNRQGETGIFKCKFTPYCTKFSDII